MGVNLGELSSKEEINLDVLKGRMVGVDSFNILYQFLSSIRGYDGTPLQDSQGRITSHLAGLLYRTSSLVEKEIKPVFVFDGEHHKLKSETVAKRNEIRTQAKEKFEEAKKKGKEKEMRKYAQQALRLTPKMVEESKQLLEYLGLPVVQAPSEGEAQASFMTDNGDLYGCVSQDFDVLLFGGKVLLRNITVSGKRKIPNKDIYVDVKPEKIELEKTLQELGISREKLIWIAILVGNDFSEKFPKIGPKTALNLVKKFDSFERIIKETKHKPNFDYKEILNIFLNPEHSKDYSLKFSSPNNEKVLEFLCEEREFSKERVENALNKLELKAKEKGTQSRLDAWG